MKHLAGPLAASILVLASSAAAVQGQEASKTTSPRVELGVGGGGLFVPSGEAFAIQGIMTSRVGVRLGRGWSVEALCDLVPNAWSDQSFSGWYRVQARWRFSESRVPGGSALFMTIGGAGGFSIDHYTAYRWVDGSGRTHVIPARTYTSVSAPYYPTAGIGIEKVLDSRVALRFEVAGAVAIGDDYLIVPIQPTVSVSIPLGR